MPELIGYIITGFIFCKTFRFVSLVKNPDNTEHILIESLVVGFIVCNLFGLIPLKLPQSLQSVSLCVVSLISASVCAKVSSGKIIQIVLEKLHIRETGNQYLWDDLLDNKYPMRATVAYDNARYSGVVGYVESFSNNPHITLMSYMVSSGGKLYDYRDDATKTIVLDTSKAQFVEITYNKNSDMCNEIKDACKYNI